jgi:ribonuclease R
MRKKGNNNSPDVPGFLQSEVFKIFQQFPNRSFNYKQISKQIKPAYIQFLADVLGENPDPADIHQDLKKEITILLENLKNKEEIIEVSRGTYKLKPIHSYQEGYIDITSSGAAYLLSENGDDDIFIAPRNVKNALDGDRVRIYLYARHKNQKLEGEVVEVLQRAKTEFAGLVQLSGRYAFVVPDNSKMMVDIFIPQNHLNHAQQGQKVIAEISDWPKGVKNPIGKITRILGWPGDNDVEMNSILSEFGFPLDFPQRVEEDAAKIPDTISPDEIKRRRDFRSVTTFTIDPEDAKDFDDALSLRKLDNGNWEVGVHIADVSHYVRPNSFLDKEAYSRATSVYLVDRVIPMLPEKLSNGVCSLRPHEDKLCFSAVFEMNDNAQVLNSWFGRTVIHSDRRFTYEEAQQIIETEKGELSFEILTFQRLAKILRADRFRNGAIAFEKIEVRFRLDEKGKPIGIYLKESKDANKLIEEFMLLANRSVAERIGKKHTVKSVHHSRNKKDQVNVSVEERPFVYRVHDGPVSDRLNNFAKFAGKWGYSLQTGNDKEIAQSLNSLMKSLHGKKEQNVLEQLAVRTMSKATYTVENIGHYGLAFDYYTHFTSPIRRYPDVMVHRLLDLYLRGENKVDKTELENQCKHSTQMEIRASEAERASIKYKQVEFLQDKIGEVFDGIISGVTEWGLYVEITENKCEGMIRLRDLDDDFYEFDDTNYCVVGARTRNKYTLGDNVKIQVVRCDLLKKQNDFKLITDVNRVPRPVAPLKMKRKTHQPRKTSKRR